MNNPLLLIVYQLIEVEFFCNYKESSRHFLSAKPSETEIDSLTFHVLRIIHAANQLIQSFTPISRRHYNRNSKPFTYRLKQIINKDYKIKADFRYFMSRRFIDEVIF